MVVECVICYEHLQSTADIYHTPCGHVFHRPCLTKWFERSKTCPECREQVAETTIKRIYLHFSPDSVEDISATLQAEIANLNHVILMKEIEIVESTSNNSTLSTLLKIKDKQISALSARIWYAQDDKTVWKHTVEVQKKELETAKSDIARLTHERDEAINSSKAHWEEISKMFHGVKDHGSLVEMIAVMKRQMEENVATLAIDKIVLQKRINDLETMLNPDRPSESSIPRRSIDEIDADFLIPTKKMKIFTMMPTASESSSISGESIDVIDLTEEIVQPVIDLTETETVEIGSAENVEHCDNSAISSAVSNVSTRRDEVSRCTINAV